MVLFFGGIVYAAQSRSTTKPTDTKPVLPADADFFKPISKAPPQQQAYQQQPQQQKQPTQTYGVESEPKASYSATIMTSKGDIKVALFAKDAPQTVQNFINKAQVNFYGGLTFHRVEDWVIQGGDPQGNGTGGGQMQTELNALPFIEGSLGIARGSNPQISNDSQFFITKSEASWLNQQYTNFGQVTSGMDVVMKIKKGDKITGVIVEK